MSVNHPLVLLYLLFTQCVVKIRYMLSLLYLSSEDINRFRIGEHLISGPLMLSINQKAKVALWDCITLAAYAT